MSVSQSYMSRIGNHVAMHGDPNVVSIADNTHIFHFEESDWRDAEILFVNRNGHHFRAAKSGGQFQYVKHWDGKPNFGHWEKWQETSLRRTNPEDLIKLCGVGPQGKTSYETLTLLPKGTTRFRKVVWRDKILTVRWGEVDAFTLSHLGKCASFNGLVWNSREAAEWCAANLGAPLVSTSQTPFVKQQDEELMMALEASDAWGMF